MANRSFNAILLILASILVASSVEAFTVTSTSSLTCYKLSSCSSSTSLQMNVNDIFTSANTIESTSNTIAAATVDPTTALTQALGVFLNTPLILVVPIVAAISVASLIAWFIVSYANPTEPDE